ncbi:MAG: hypothetical protein WCO51_11815, partial [bacterium]
SKGLVSCLRDHHAVDLLCLRMTSRDFRRLTLMLMEDLNSSLTLCGWPTTLTIPNSMRLNGQAVTLPAYWAPATIALSHMTQAATS